MKTLWYVPIGIVLVLGFLFFQFQIAPLKMAAIIPDLEVLEFQSSTSLRVKVKSSKEITP